MPGWFRISLTASDEMVESGPGRLRAGPGAGGDAGSLMRRSAKLVVLLGLLAGTAAGCGRGQATIPPGGQQVHVVVTAADVRLEPDTVRAGDIYLVLDTPGTSVGFALRQAGAAETPGPMSDEDIDRLARGDTEGMAISGFDDSGCSADQRAEDRGRMGPCGNVFHEELTPGKYAFFVGQAEGAGPQSIAVLEVRP